MLFYISNIISYICYFLDWTKSVIKLGEYIELSLIIITNLSEFCNFISRNNYISQCFFFSNSRIKMSK
ncbi:hypothetical protein RhiirA5_347176 [Rhizophagus irregularis]|uniref:Uncharacterized protein n=1 Tax=Rhizophagus irregularis TaxID=588596 RepID=A0A2N0QCL0_9GLOM|nr:hypothetical protein RhiirA5_347176 [Rhizophagus irregularis]